MRRVGNAVLEVRDTRGPVAGLAVRVTCLDFAVDVQTWVDEERIYLARGMRTDTDGLLKLSGLPNGRYRAEIDLPKGGTLDRDFVVPRAGTADISLTIP